MNQQGREMLRRLGALALIVALALCATVPAQAQDIPEHIPDGPEDLVDKKTRQLKERHHEFLSRLFSTSQSGLLTQRAEQGLGAFVYESIGLRLERDRSLAFSVGVQQPGVLGTAPVQPCALRQGTCLQTTVLLSAQYELPLQQIVSTEALPGRADRYRVGFGLGLRSGPVDALRMAVTPQYMVSVNRYWTLSLGAAAGVDAIGELSGARPFVGAQLGVVVFPWGRRHDVLR